MPPAIHARETLKPRPSTPVRFQGRVSEWNDDRGFGFIVQNGGDPKAFLHVSAFLERGDRPTIGGLVTYEVVADGKGRLPARSVRYVGRPLRQAREKRASLAVLPMLALVAVGSYLGYTRVLPGLESSPEAGAYGLLSPRELPAGRIQFQCEPRKSSCSQMSSCEEAYFHQNRCGVSGMDGDNDGIPCERQWCGGWP
jgi:cold shock CspA family protein